jgi:serine/threonine protein phosphatase PrpC
LEAQPLLRTDPEAALLKAHSEMNRSIMESWLDVSFSGSTSVSVLIRGSNITCANVGDSRAILGSLKPGESSWQSTALSTDHKPDDPGEQERIKAKKGRVMAYKGHQGEPMGPARVWLKNKDLPGLAMSRSFGDKIASSVGVIAEPTITKTDLTRNDKIIVIASDGVWEFLSNDQVIEIVSIHYENDDPKAAVEDLIHCATDRWKEKEDVIDDITAVVIFLKVP